MTDDGDGLKKLTMDADAFRKIMAENVKVAQQMENRMVSFAATAKTFEAISGAFNQMSSTLASLTEESKQYGEAMREANTMAGKDAAGFGKLKDQVADLAKEIPLTRDLLAKGLYQTISNGVPEDNWMTFLQTSARSAVGGLADINQVVGVTSTVIKNYGLEWEAAAEIQDKIQLTAKNGVTSFEQLAAALPRVTGNAATLGVSIDELLGTFATLTGVSGNTAEVSTQLAAIFTALVKPSSEAAKMAEAMGIKFDAAAVKAAGGFHNFLVQLDTDVKSYARTAGVLEQEVYAKLFGSAESLRALIPLQGELADKFAENVANMENSAGTMDDAFKEMSSSGEAVFQKWTNKMAAFTDFATSLISKAQPFINFGNQITGTLSSLAVLTMAFKQLQARQRVCVLLSKQACAWFTTLGLRGKSTAVAMRIFSAAAQSSAYSLTAVKLAVRGLLVATGVGIAIAALTTAINYLWDAADKATDSVDELDNAMDEYKNAAAEAKVQIDKDIESLGTLIKAHKDTTAAVNHLNETYGTYLGTHKTAVEWYDILTSKSQAYIKQIGYESQARAIASKIAEAAVRRDMAVERKRELARTGKARVNVSKSVGGTNVTSQGVTVQEDSKEYKEAKKQKADAEADLAAYQKELDAITRLKKQNAKNLPVMPEVAAQVGITNPTSSTGIPSVSKKPAPEGSVGYYEDKISDIRAKIRLEIDPASRAELYKELTNLEYTKHRIEFEYKYPHSPGDLTGDLPTPKLVPEIDVSKITPVLEDTSGAFGDMGKEGKASTEDIAGAFDQLGSSISGLGNAIEMPELNIAGTMAQAIATMVQGFATATSQSASMGPWAWVAFAALGLAQLTAMISTVKQAAGFATGGIVGGTSKTGDKVLARVNSGEMILNATQQRNLFRMLNTPQVTMPQFRTIAPQPNTTLVQSITREPVIIGGTIRLRNRDLVVALANETRIASKSGRRTNIKI